MANKVRLFHNLYCNLFYKIQMTVSTLILTVPAECFSMQCNVLILKVKVSVYSYLNRWNQNTHIIELDKMNTLMLIQKHTIAHSCLGFKAQIVHNYWPVTYCKECAAFSLALKVPQCQVMNSVANK